MPLDLTDSTVLTVTPEHVAGQVGGEAVILSLQDGIYYSLNEVGTRVWELLKQRRSVGEVITAIQEEFDVDPDRCRRDVHTVLEQLIAARLLETGDAATA